MIARVRLYVGIGPDCSRHHPKQVRVVVPGRRQTVLRMELQRTRFRVSAVGWTGIRGRLLDPRHILWHGRRQVQQVIFCEKNTFSAYRRVYFNNGA